MHQLSVGIGALMLVLSACSGQTPTAPASVPASALAGAPTQVTVSGKTLTLTTNLWRDFMPISPPEGKPLVAALQIRTGDASHVPSEVTADMVWVIHGDALWSATPREDRTRAETSPVYEVIARDGPKWGPGISVEVVVRLRDAAARSYLLRAPKQMIGGTF
jgi:hypothetical protein